MRRACIALGLVLACVGASAATHVVTIEGMVFEPATISVKRGDTIVWKNRDITPHTATATGRFDSREIAGGRSWTWTAGVPGRYDYVCTFHLGMKGSVVVE